jgi:hypothetical protein
MSTLRSTIADLAQQFALGVLRAIRSAPLDDILGQTAGGTAKRGPGRPRKAGSTSAARTPKVGRGGRLARRSATDITKVVESIVALLSKHADGLRAEQIRAELGLDKKEIGRPISEALASKVITKKGEKRATTYFAGGKSGRAKS